MVCRIVKNHPDIEVVHVFTHGGDQLADECDAGLFKNRGKYYSPLRKTQRIDNYKKMIIPVDCQRGLISFEAEAIAIEEILKIIPHIKSVDDLTSIGSWDTVMANKSLRIGTHTPATKMVIYLGFGLKDPWAAGTIKVNPHGKVRVNPQQATESKPHKKRKKHVERRLPVPPILLPVPTLQALMQE